MSRSRDYEDAPGVDDDEIKDSELQDLGKIDPARIGAALREAAAEALPLVVASLKKQVRKGNTDAARVLLMYAAPVPKDEMVRLDLDGVDLATPDGLVEAANRTVHAIASGQLKPSDGELISKMLRDLKMMVVDHAAIQHMEAIRTEFVHAKNVRGGNMRTINGAANGAAPKGNKAIGSRS